jgi:serine/threonine protein phosphatase Stp1
VSAPPFRISEGAVSDVGRVRSANEDSFLARGEVGLWAVADGMGGHDNGQWASQTLVRSLSDAKLGREFEEDVQAVADAIHAANGVIFSTASAQARTMGCTVTTLLLWGDRFAVLWAGDSRVYVSRRGRLHRLTRDHTQVQALVDAGALSQAEAERHPMSHVLARAVGVEEMLRLDAVSDQVEGGDKFLLCSDGLTGVVSEAEIAEALAQFSPRVACEELLARCLARGAPDNVTVVVVGCEQPTLRLPV